MKKNLKIAKEKIANFNNKGITLIALVVTIVVLLILAGITITAVLSEGGIFSTAKRAQSMQDEAAIKEKVQVMLADAQLEKLVNNKTLKSYLEENGYTVTEDTTAGTVTIPVDGYNVTVNSSTLEITGMEKADGSGSGTGGNEGGTNPPSNPTVAVTGVSLDKETETMTVGGSLTLVATVAPETASNKTVTWTSSVPSVATVTNGVVNALTAGSTTITVTTTDGSFTAECDITVNVPKPTVADLVNKPAASTNTYTEDKYGNKIVIPAGFTVLGNGGETYVVYDWDKNQDGTQTNIPVVQDGIVIQDGEGNEFVWVPVGEIYNDTTGKNVTQIKLGRYNTWTMDENTTPPTPPSPKQEADKDTCDTVTANDIIISGVYSDEHFEITTGEYEGIIYKGAKFTTLGSWIGNTIDNGGYYIARYEASYGVDRKANSKPSSGTPLNSNANASSAKKEGQLWNFISQEDASTVSKAMYQASENLGYYSELMNSYAWDTAIIFIQTYQDVNYANQESQYTDFVNYSQPANTGERGATVEVEGSENSTDKVCNIYDMASNVREWTTESSTYSTQSYSARGGYFYNRASANQRGYGWEAENITSFRPLLDVALKAD